MASSIGSHKNVRWKSVLDFLAVAGPIICLIDCVVLPVASALLPFLGMTEFGHAINDQQLFLLVLAICGPIIIPGYLKHRNKRVLAMFAIAISLMFIVNFIDLIADETAHAVISLTAACLLIKANRDNKKLVTCACSMHHHGTKHETPAIQASAAFSQLIAIHNDHVHSSSCSHGSVEGEAVALDSQSHQTRTSKHLCQTAAAGLSPQQHHHTDSHALCVHEVVNALEMQDHGLKPDHFEPRNSLNFEPVATADAPHTVPVPSVGCC